MKLLIITSEKLNPDNILTSIFELAQATILSRTYDVTILSVDLEASFFSSIKALLRNDRRGPGLLTVLRVLLAGRTRIHHYVIDGNKVVESEGFFWRSPKSFKPGLAGWIRTGMAGFDAYVEKNGTPDLVHAHGRFLYAGALALAIKKKTGIKYIYTEHSTYFQRGLVPTEAYAVCKEVIDEAAAFIVVSKSLLQEMQRVLQTEFPRARIIPNALDPAFERPIGSRPGEEKGDESFVFTVVAALEHKKGIDVLVRAFGKAVAGKPQLFLNICGDGPMKDEIASFLASNGLEKRVRLLGKKTKEEVIAILNQSDAFVLPSRIETFGVVVIEALSRGLPVVATRSGGPEFILDDNCGILIEPEDAVALEAALVRMASDHRQFDRQGIQTYALTRYGSGKFLETMEKIYSEKTCS